MLRVLSFVCGLAWSVAALGAADRALTPEEALKSFRLEPGLRIESVSYTHLTLPTILRV